MQSTYDKIQYYKLQQKDKNKIVEKLRRILAQKKSIKLALIFGSITRRNNIRDIDVCIHSNPTLTFNELLNLNAHIELDLGIPVDLSELSTLPNTLKLNIMKEGVIIKGQRRLADKLLIQAQSKELRKNLQEIKPRAEKRKTRTDSALLIRKDRER